MENIKTNLKHLQNKRIKIRFEEYTRTTKIKTKYRFIKNNYD